jgi:hypothetical protein
MHWGAAKAVVLKIFHLLPTKPTKQKQAGLGTNLFLP